MTMTVDILDEEFKPTTKKKEQITSALQAIEKGAVRLR